MSYIFPSFQARILRSLRKHEYIFFSLLLSMGTFCHIINFSIVRYTDRTMDPRIITDTESGNRLAGPESTSPVKRASWMSGLEVNLVMVALGVRPDAFAHSRHALVLLRSMCPFDFLHPSPPLYMPRW